MKAQHLIKFVMMLVLTGNAEALFAQSSGTYNLQITSDTYVSQFNPSNNYGRSADLVAGTDWEFGYLYRTYLRFDHTPIPADAEVLSAQLKIYMSYGTYYSEQYRLEIRKVTEVWDENTLNWKNQPGSASLVHIMTKAVDEEPGWKSFDITETVREWIGGSTKNRGVVMMAADESGELGECRFYSRESSGCRPYIQVIYLTNSMLPDSPDAPVCNMSGDDTPPDVDITFSKNPVELGSSTYVTVSASDSEGIHMVQLYRGNTLVITKTDDFARISLSVSGFVTPEEAGPAMFFAVAYNDRMQCTRVSERLLVQVDGEAPSVSIYHLPSHPAMGENVTFHASASDPSGIANLSIDVNGVRHFLDITQGANTVSGSLQINNANIFYDPPTTRLVTYAATSYDMEGNHTTYGPHTVIFGGNSGTDSDGDGLGDEIEEILGTDPHANDTDDDGLYDSWEVLGVDRDNNGVIDLDLPGFGASPHQKDLFIEVDWMEDANHSHKPHPWAIQTVINHFMCYGIRVHVDVGSMGGGNAVPHMEDMNIGDTKLNHLLNIKLAHCDPARYGIFRYALFGHGWGQYFGTGNMTVRSDPPNNENHYDEPYFQAKQFIHEIGHSLALGHGGQSLTQMSEAYSLDQQCYLFRNDVASWINTNYKPNYLSMMNYLYSSNNGLRARTTDGQDIMLLGFSQNLCGTHDLDENHLNESVGFNYPLDWGMYTWKRQGEILHRLNDWFEGTYYLIDVKEWAIDENGVYEPKTSDWILADGRPIDWDHDGNDSETDVSADINMNGGMSLLTFENDVDNLVLQIRSSHQDRFMANTRSSEVEYELTTEFCDGKDNDRDGMIDEGYPDLDLDGVADFIDNALNAYNPKQVDINRNFIGDYVEIPLAKAANLTGSFDQQKVFASLTWKAPYPAPALLGFNVYRKDRSGNFKRLGVSFPTTLEERYVDNGPFSLEVQDTVTYYVRPVNLYRMEGRRSDYLTLRPSINTTDVLDPTLTATPVRCFPNPFTTHTWISYSLPEGGSVSVAVYNLLGERINILLDEWQPAGPHMVVWDGTGSSGARLPAGCYICRIHSEDAIHTFRILLSD